MLNLFFRCWEYVFPERNDHRLVRLAEISDLLIHLNPTIDKNFVSLLPFSETLVRATIHEAKFHANPKAWKLLGEVLSRYLKHCPEDTLILPIPLSKRRRKERGYNQVTEIIKMALKVVNKIELREDILIRLRETPPQTSLKKVERVKNMEGAFDTLHTNSLTNKNIIIVDDVTTTGATLSAAEASLLPHLQHSQITLLSLTH